MIPNPGPNARFCPVCERDSPFFIVHNTGSADNMTTQLECVYGDCAAVFDRALSWNEMNERLARERV